MLVLTGADNWLLVLIEAEKKFPIFDQNHGLTLSEKVEFFVNVKIQSFFPFKRLANPKRVSIPRDQNNSKPVYLDSGFSYYDRKAREPTWMVSVNCFKFYRKISLFLLSLSSPCLRQCFVDVNILVPMVEQALARYKCDANTAVRFKLGKR